MRLIAIALATLLLAAAPADAAPTRNCGPKSAPTVAQSSAVRVYGEKQDFAACWRRSRVKPMRGGHRDGQPLDMRIASSGSFALLVDHYPAGTQEVMTVEADGAHSLDSGPDMDVHSLAVGGSHVYWTRAGEAHTAPIR